METFNKSKMTELDYSILQYRYDEKELKRVLKMIDDDYPVQYAIGDVDFLGYKIKVDERVLIPRFETELLVDKLLKYIVAFGIEHSRIVDVCTGSGCIAVALKKRISSATVVGIDKSPDALDIARENATCLNADILFVERDVLVDMNLECKFDVLVSNPPYVKEDEPVAANTKYEPAMALYPGEDDIIFYRRILEQAQDFMSDRFIIAFEIGSTQGERVCKLVRQFFPNASVSLEQDYAGLDRFIFIFSEKMNER